MDLQWTVQPFNDGPVQFDNVSCGVWVIAQMFAVMRGFRRVGINNRGISRWFRDHIYYLLLQLPLVADRDAAKRREMHQKVTLGTPMEGTNAGDPDEDDDASTGAEDDDGGSSDIMVLDGPP